MYLYRYFVVLGGGMVHCEVLDQVGVMDTAALNPFKLLLDGQHLQQ